jgi:hypothetical protein
VNDLRVPLQDLEEAKRLVTLFGVANDAFDRGSAREADQLREEASMGIRSLVAKYPSLVEWMPRLPAMLDEGLLVYTWPKVLNAIENAIADGSSDP